MFFDLVEIEKSKIHIGDAEVSAACHDLEPCALVKSHGLIPGERTLFPLSLIAEGVGVPLLLQCRLELRKHFEQIAFSISTSGEDLDHLRIGSSSFDQPLGHAA